MGGRGRASCASFGLAGAAAESSPCGRPRRPTLRGRRAKGTRGFVAPGQCCPLCLGRGPSPPLWDGPGALGSQSPWSAEGTGGEEHWATEASPPPPRAAPSPLLSQRCQDGREAGPGALRQSGVSCLGERRAGRAGEARSRPAQPPAAPLGEGRLAEAPCWPACAKLVPLGGGSSSGSGSSGAPARA